MENKRARATALIRQELTREQMQRETHIIETLLDAAQAVFGGLRSDEALGLIEMASQRAGQLSHSLDSLYSKKVVK